MTDPTPEKTSTFDAFAWVDRAVCGEPDSQHMMFPHPMDTVGIELAKAACRRCPVVDPCLDRALAAGESHGIWGGLTPEERRQLKRRESRARAREAAESGAATPVARQPWDVKPKTTMSIVPRSDAL